MREADLVATMTVHYASDGVGEVEAGANTVAAAQDRVSASAQAMATSTEDASRRQVSAAAAFDAMSRRMDPAVRAYADLQRNQTAFSNALANNSSITDRAGQGLDVYREKINAQRTAVEALVRQQEVLASQQRALTSIPVRAQDAINKSFNVDQVAPPSSAKASASAFFSQADIQAQVKATDDMAASVTRLMAAQNPLEAEQGRLAAQLALSKAAFDAGKISQEVYSNEQIKAGEALEAYATKLNTAATAAENLRRQQSNLSTNTTVSSTSNPTQITGAQLSNVNVGTYAAQFELAAKANDDMMASVARLTASLNPFEAEQGRIAAQMLTYKAALDAGKMSQDVFAAETEKANLALAAYAEKLNTAATAAENLRRQQSNLSTNTTASSTTNPTQITGQQLSNVDTKQYAAQFEAAAKAQDDQTASLARLRAEMNPLEVEQGKLGAQSAIYNAALKSGAMTAAEYATAQAMLGNQLGSAGAMAKSAAAATGEFGLAAGIGSTQAMALFAALRHMFDATAAGIPITRVLAMEIGNLSYGLSGAGGIMSGVGAVFSKIGSFLSPLNLLAGGTIALGAAAAYVAVSWSNAQREIERALIGIGQRTGTTSDDINKFATANATATGLSVTQARNAAIELTKTGDVSISGLKGVGDAIHGFSVMTGTTAADATKVFAKALGGDAVQAAEELNKTYGFLDASTRDYIRTLEMQGDRSMAIQVILDAMAKDNQKAADSVGILSKAWAGLGNILASIKTPAPPSLSDQIGSLQQQRDAIANAPSTLGGNYGKVENFVDPGIAAKAAALAEIDKQIDALQKKEDGFSTGAAVKQLAEFSLAADNATRATIPQIAQLENLQKAEMALVLGRNLNDPKADAALTANRNQQAAIQESEAEAARYNQRVAEISRSWDNVGQSTALALQSARNQLPVIEAVGGRAKMAAQYAADYRDAMDKGKTATEATALAGSHLQATQAQIKSQAQETLFNLQNQAQVASAVTGSAQIRAQSEATYNQLLHDGVDASTASSVAAQQEANARAKATASVKEQTHSIEQNTEMLVAQQNGTQAQVAAAQAYENAIRSGADALSASALSAATLTNELTKASIEAQKVVDAGIDRANGTQNGITTQASWQQYISQHESPFTPHIMPAGDLTYGGNVWTGGGVNQIDLGQSAIRLLMLQADQEKQGVSGPADTAYGTGGIAAGLASITGAPNSFGADPVIAKALQNSKNTIDALAILGPQTSTMADKMSTYDSLVQLQNAKTNDKDIQVSNLQSEMAWLNTLPETIARDQKIVSLQQSIDQLKNSTDANTAATQATLNPLYSQGHGALAIGYYKAATGLEGIVGGNGGTDSTDVHMMLTPGEHLKVTPQGQSTNDNSRQTNIVQNFYGQSTSNQRRSRRQSLQGFAQSIAAAG